MFVHAQSRNAFVGDTLCKELPMCSCSKLGVGEPAVNSINVGSNSGIAWKLMGSS